MAQRIVVAGMRRSGTTWLYNAARLLCEQQSPGHVWAGAFDAGYRPTLPGRWHVVKIHRYRQDLARDARVLTSFRPLSDVRRSFARMNGWYPTWGHVSKWTWSLMMWQRQACYCLWYPDLVYSPSRELRRVATALGLGTVDRVAVMAQLNTLLPPSGEPSTAERDPVTLLYRGHRAIEGSSL